MVVCLVVGALCMCVFGGRHAEWRQQLLCQSRAQREGGEDRTGESWCVCLCTHKSTGHRERVRRSVARVLVTERE